VRRRLSGPHRRDPPSEPRRSIELIRQIVQRPRIEDECSLALVPYAHPSEPHDVLLLPTTLTRGLQSTGAVLTARSPWSGRRIEQTQLHASGMLRKERKVDAFAVPCGTEGIGLAWPLCGRVRSPIHGPIPALLNYALNLG